MRSKQSEATIIIGMDHYSAERWMLERHRSMVESAERRAALAPVDATPVRVWVAWSLRALADRLDGAPLAASRQLRI